jgi:hypothetical protein
VNTGDRKNSCGPRLSPMQRIQLAKRLRMRAATEQNLSPAARAELRRHVFNLMALNMSAAKWRKAEEGDR